MSNRSPPPNLSLKCNKENNPDLNSDTIGMGEECHSSHTRNGLLSISGRNDDWKGTPIIFSWFCSNGLGGGGRDGDLIFPSRASYGCRSYQKGCIERMEALWFHWKTEDVSLENRQKKAAWAAQEHRQVPIRAGCCQVTPRRAKSTHLCLLQLAPMELHPCITPWKFQALMEASYLPSKQGVRIIFTDYLSFSLILSWASGPCPSPRLPQAEACLK